MARKRRPVVEARNEAAAPSFHVFDQTNGVLDAADWAESAKTEERRPPDRFGVPPIVSL